jgi:hypothetical protein
MAQDQTRRQTLRDPRVNTNLINVGGKLKTIPKASGLKNMVSKKIMHNSAIQIKKKGRMLVNLLPFMDAFLESIMLILQLQL